MQYGPVHLTKRQRSTEPKDNWTSSHYIEMEKQQCDFTRQANVDQWPRWSSYLTLRLWYFKLGEYIFTRGRYVTKLRLAWDLLPVCEKLEFFCVFTFAAKS